eukprot:8713435-Lingulodinium_polyedra.AAC.1
MGQSYLFDRRSRRKVAANDFMYAAAPNGLPGILDYLRSNSARVDAIPAREDRKMRYVFETMG